LAQIFFDCATKPALSGIILVSVFCHLLICLVFGGQRKNSAKATGTALFGAV
jgi:hypothetical protein